MKTFFAFLFGAAVTGALLGAFALHVPLAFLATLAVGVACLSWLVVIVVLPWNLYFQARHVLVEMKRSRARGIPVGDEQEAETRRVQARMLRISIGLHLVSAALLWLGSYLSNEPLGSAFAALFLLSTLFRPAVEYYRYLRGHLGDVLNEVKYPRDDVAKLVADVKRDGERVEALEAAHRALTAQLATLEHSSMARTSEAYRRLDTVARKFDEALDRLTDNREVISGLKAFLRLVREPTGAE